MLPGTLVIIAVTLVVWTLAFLYFRNFLRRRTGSRRILEEFQEEVDKLIAEINSAADSGLTLMEDRITHLKTLLEETDRRISAYKKEMERRAMHEHAYAELGRKTVVKSKPDLPSLFDINTESAASQRTEKSESHALPDRHDLPRDAHYDNAELGDTRLSNEGPRFIRSSIRVETKVPFSEQVLHLANAGFTAELIAHRLGAAVAEVELAIALAKKH